MNWGADLGDALKIRFLRHVRGCRWMYRRDAEALKLLGNSIVDLVDKMAKIEQEPEYLKFQQFLDDRDIDFDGFGNQEGRQTVREHCAAIKDIQPVYEHEGHKFFASNDFDHLQSMYDKAFEIIQWVSDIGLTWQEHLQAYYGAGHEYDGADINDEFEMMMFRYEAVSRIFTQAMDEMALEDLSK